MPDVFLSYAHADAPAAMRLADGLQARGLTVFRDFAIVAGEDFSRQIESALADSAAVVVLLSSHASRSHWVESELRSALKSRKNIIPVLLGRDATENWVWPLISDRQAVQVESEADFHNVVAQVMMALGRTVPTARDPMASAPMVSAPGASAPARARSVSWLTVIIAVLSGLIGAIISWLAR